ncbi:MAG: hypothetical protein IPL96_17365 [Holophagaceae bacterium]|nr:hypothetical protein [Holophagaceae bacterium]
MAHCELRMIELSQLEIVGYADVLRAGTIPRRVAPIFRYIEDKTLIDARARGVFPPFRLIDEFVLNGTVAPMSDLEAGISAHRATRLGAPIPACPSSLLWIDENLIPHYGPHKEVNADLQAQARERYKLAKTKFLLGQYDAARSLARWACAADPRLWLALALQAAMRQLESKPAEVELLEDYASEYVDASDFHSWIELLIREYQLGIGTSAIYESVLGGSPTQDLSIDLEYTAYIQNIESLLTHRQSRNNSDFKKGDWSEWTKSKSNNRMLTKNYLLDPINPSESLFSNKQKPSLAVNE